MSPGRGRSQMNRRKREPEEKEALELGKLGLGWDVS